MAENNTNSQRRPMRVIRDFEDADHKSLRNLLNREDELINMLEHHNKRRAIFKLIVNITGFVLLVSSVFAIFYYG